MLPGCEDYARDCVTKTATWKRRGVKITFFNMDNSSSEYIGGIPSKVLTELGESDALLGRISGGSLRYKNTERSIKIFDKTNDSFRFEIEVSEDGFIKLDIYTKDKNKIKHPDLYARKLVEKALEVFRQRGFKIEGIAAQWFLKGRLAGDNSREYLTNLLNGMSEAKAAKNTSTGKLAKDLDFPQD